MIRAVQTFQIASASFKIGKFRLQNDGIALRRVHVQNFVQLFIDEIRWGHDNPNFLDLIKMGGNFFGTVLFHSLMNWFQ